MNELTKIQEWYLSQCNGDWEHQNGINIGTLDNPGWLIEIDLVETELETKPFKPVGNGVAAESIEDSPDWFTCKVENKKFTGSCGPLYLNTVLKTFLDWANN